MRWKDGMEEDLRRMGVDEETCRRREPLTIQGKCGKKKITMKCAVEVLRVIPFRGESESDFSDPEIEEFRNLRLRGRPQGYKNSIVIRPIPSRCGQQDMSADPTIPNKMSDSERSGDYSYEEKKITDESAAESILVLEPYMFEPYETENENTCLNVIQSRKLKGRLVGHRTSKYGMCDYCEVMPLVIESWCCREIEEVHCETVRTQQDVLFIVETNSFRIQIVAWMQMFSVAQTMHTSTNMAGMHSNMIMEQLPTPSLESASELSTENEYESDIEVP
ncbi:hypothetical protein GQR58_021101 [Nymphon striatum]|nr:hypothetical protein GQR58_021101 [Nymphon striatum]